MEEISLEGIPIKIIRKKMRSIRVRINRLNGEVKLSAPLRLAFSHIMDFLKERFDWIKKHHEQAKKNPAPKPKKFLDGDEIDFFGKKIRLEIIEHEKTPRAELHEDRITLYAKPRVSLEARRKALEALWRRELKKKIPDYIAPLEKKMKVKVHEFGIKKMKTRWGTCNTRAHRIWINLELAKKPLDCLEFIVTHEMVHLLERNHTKKFFAHMDHFMPNWKEVRSKLNSSMTARS